ncbi:hypothetical protein BP00DRAFT_417610 [Aspergillus indologenus CBS 114.80]|uniref:Uncharacterized protein n=1 Tax=Aspergillus indologenus CBS 114.80 TaxID=1450541 RepID=A0A2V5IXI9_9EURO|nr:hypothetical protein BP00DRAFT_417610 [Aspergillus indologenus CBS 114.80]
MDDRGMTTQSWNEAIKSVLRPRAMVLAMVGYKYYAYLQLAELSKYHHPTNHNSDNNPQQEAYPTTSPRTIIMSKFEIVPVTLDSTESGVGPLETTRGSDDGDAWKAHCYTLVSEMSHGGFITEVKWRTTPDEPHSVTEGCWKVECQRGLIRAFNTLRKCRPDLDELYGYILRPDTQQVQLYRQQKPTRGLGGNKLDLFTYEGMDTFVDRSDIDPTCHVAWWHRALEARIPNWDHIFAVGSWCPRLGIMGTDERMWLQTVLEEYLNTETKLVQLEVLLKAAVDADRGV